MNYGFAFPLVLLLLPLALLPFLRSGQTAIPYSSVALLPKDRLSNFVDVALKIIAAVALASIIIGLSGLFRAEESIERIGQGAQMVMLLDSSGSMDRPYITGNENRGRVIKWGTYVSKGQIARDLLAKYAAERQQDMFAMFVFSGNPIAVLPLTEKQDIVQAAIEAGSIERGLATTNLAGGLVQSLEFFEGKAFTGSRIIMLVSDGAARLTLPQQDRIKQLMERHRVTLYWIYLRDQEAPGLHTEMDAARAEDIAPEQLVHQFFTETGLPYRAFPAENPEALQNAIREVDKLQNLPIRYQDVIPKKDLTDWCYALALGLLIITLGAKLFEIQSWR